MYIYLLITAHSTLFYLAAEMGVTSSAAANSSLWHRARESRISFSRLSPWLGGAVFPPILRSSLLSPLFPRKTRLRALSSWRLCKCSSQCPRVVVMCARALSISDPRISISPPLFRSLSFFLFRAPVCVCALIARLKAATEAVFTKYGHRGSHRSKGSLAEIRGSKAALNA